MPARVVHRPARTRVDPLPKTKLEISAPPSLDEPTNPQEGAVMRLAMPLVAGGGMMLMMASSGNMIRMVAGLGFILVAVCMGLGMYIRGKTGNRKRTEMQRQTYVKFLTRTRKEIAEEIELQREVQFRLHPDPPALLTLIVDPSRVYERRRHDPDFAVVRIGTGAGPLAREINYASTNDPVAIVDEIAAAHLERTKGFLERIDNIPLGLPLQGIVSIIGSQSACHAVLRAGLTQLMALHAPEDVAVHLCLGFDTDPYDWLLFSPHLLDPDAFDGPVHKRRTTTNHQSLQSSLGTMLGDRAAEATKRTTSFIPSPFLVVVVDLDDSAGQQPLALFPPGTTPEMLGVCIITMCRRRISEPSEITKRVEVTDDGKVTVEDPTPDYTDPTRWRDTTQSRLNRLVTGAPTGSLDSVSQGLAGAIARELAPIRLAAETTKNAPLESTVTIEALLGIDDIGTFNPAETWRQRPVPEFLKVPFGVDTAGNHVYLDLKESALEGHGPHGLCIGATGSGKSEVLRTIVLAQAINHPPERLAFVLVDYKGGAAFAGLDILPHTAAMVDNLGDQEGLVDRLHDAISGEMQRRMRVLQDAGAKNVYDYNDRRDAGGDLAPLPNLAVIIDEFGEILVQKPEFLDLFVQIGRIGRSIGIHLLLASQRLEEGRLRGLESHLSYRLGLRTFSAGESRVVIGTTDAHTLPALPGSGYLKVDPDVYARFKAAYVSGRYEPKEERISFDLPPMPIPYAMSNVIGDWLDEQKTQFTEAMKASAAQKREESPFDKIALEVAAERMAKVGTKVNQLWLPPLPAELQLEELLGGLELTPDRGLQCPGENLRSTLAFPIALMDDPTKQWQGTFSVETASSNVMILGAPQTGKTTTARAIVLGAAVTHTPMEASWYLIDAASTSLGDLDELPNVGGVATRFDPDKIQRAVAEMAFEMARREELFTQYRIASVDQLRKMVADNQILEVTVADRYLLVDGWATLANEFEHLVPVITDLAVRGLGYGLHVIIVTNRIPDMRTNLHTNIGTTIEHRLPNPVDSSLSRPMQQRLSVQHRGRIVTPSKNLAQVINASGETSRGLITKLGESWAGPAAPVIRTLPDHISYHELMSAEAVPATPAVIGVDESTLSPVRIDLMGEDPHVLILGDGESGKTTLLRTVVGDLVNRRDVRETNVVVVDPRRSLLDFVPKPPLMSYTSTAEQAKGMFERLRKFLDARMPGPDVTAQQLKTRSWWSGPEMVVVVDDYDLLVPSSTSPNPLAPLVPLLPHSRDIGLHIVLARKSSNLSRALFDPLVSGLRDNNAAGILLSGDRSEGQVYTKVYLQQEPPGRGRIVRKGGRSVRAQFADWPEDLAPIAQTNDT